MKDIYLLKVFIKIDIMNHFMINFDKLVLILMKGDN